VVEYAALAPPNGSGDTVEIFPPAPPSRLEFDFADWIEALEDRLSAARRPVEVDAKDRAILVSVSLGRDAGAEARLEEMRELARTAGIAIVDVVHQRRPVPDPRYLIGRGKLQDLVVRAWQLGADLVIFDRDLTPLQVRHIGDAVEARVVDRTQLILDIFAQHAHTSEGRLQVELAQLRYRLPRLVGRGESMSRLMGGIGGRGPGETKLEVDRRRVRERIQRLEKQLDTLATQRTTRRAKRRREGLPVLSIVGYTNAGKSTLLNRLTNSDVLVADQLFATLDPSSRRLRFPRERDVIVTDTVGFIRDLPPDLVAGFRSTLEEIHDASVIVHVADASNPEVEHHIESVRATLAELGLADKPEQLVLNKCDRLEPDEAARLAREHDGIAISALTGAGLRDLLEALEAIAFPTETSARTASRERAVGGER
jgi:GTP-binding protein HflX